MLGASARSTQLSEALGAHFPLPLLSYWNAERGKKSHIPGRDTQGRQGEKDREIHRRLSWKSQCLLTDSRADARSLPLLRRRFSGSSGGSEEEEEEEEGREREPPHVAVAPLSG